MTVWIKQGVRGSPSRHILRAMRIKHDLHQKYGENMFITSFGEGTHSAGSLHYMEPPEAFDSRPGKVPFKELVDHLPEGYDVVEEGSHIHIEWDPKE